MKIWGTILLLGLVCSCMASEPKEKNQNVINQMVKNLKKVDLQVAGIPESRVKKAKQVLQNFYREANSEDFVSTFIVDRQMAVKIGVRQAMRSKSDKGQRSSIPTEYKPFYEQLLAIINGQLASVDDTKFDEEELD